MVFSRCIHRLSQQRLSSLSTQALPLMLVFGLVACASVSPNPDDDVATKKLEKLYGTTILQSAIEVTVISTGCTTASDFVIESKKSGTLCEVKIIRTRPDLCKRSPMTAVLELPWSQSLNCQQRDIQLVNDVLPTALPDAPKLHEDRVRQ